MYPCIRRFLRARSLCLCAICEQAITRDGERNKPDCRAAYWAGVEGRRLREQKRCAYCGHLVFYKRCSFCGNTRRAAALATWAQLTAPQLQQARR